MPADGIAIKTAMCRWHCGERWHADGSVIKTA